MSGGGWKEPFYKVARQDSRNAEWLGNALGIDFLEKEGKHNKENPGRAVGKVATSAALYGIGDYLAGLGEVANVAAPAADAAIGAATSGAGTTAASIAEQQAMQQALAQGGGKGLLGMDAIQAGENVGSFMPQVAERSFNTVPVKDLSQQAGLLDKGRLALSAGSGTGKGGMLAAQMGMGMLNPQQPQQPMGAPPPQQPPAQPLNNPYGSQAGNSMGFTEEQKRKLRAMGYQI